MLVYDIPWLDSGLVKGFLTSSWEFQSPQEFDKKQVEVLLSFSPKKELLENLPNLRFILSPGAGIDNMDLEYIRARGIGIINSHSNARSVAEHAWSLLMALARKFPLFLLNERIMKGIWPPTALRMTDSEDLNGKVLGLLGFGAIGQILASYGKCFGMHVWAFKRTPLYPKVSVLDQVFNLEGKEPFLKGIDVMISTLPITAQTKDLVTAKDMKLLRSNVLIVNVGRAAVLNEEGLFQELESGRIGGLALDAQYQYQKVRDEAVPMSKYPFNKFPNVILSPHRASFSPGGKEEMAKGLAKTVDQIAKGDPTLRKINWEIGY